MNWDVFFIKQAMLVSQKSKDPSTKVGCVIVGEGDVILSIGFNGFPRGVAEEYTEYFPIDDLRVKIEHKLIEYRWERPEKYNWVEHAERNAIYNAARHGIKLLGSRAYLNWEPIPCADCARALIQAGIREVVGPNIKFPGSGAGAHYSIKHCNELFKESGVSARIVEWNSEWTI